MNIKKMLSVVFISFLYLISNSVVQAEITLKTIEQAIVQKYGQQVMKDFADARYIKTKPVDLRGIIESATLQRVENLTARDGMVVEAFAIYRLINALKHMSPFPSATIAQIIKELVVKCREELKIQVGNISTYSDSDYYNNRDDSYSPLGLSLSSSGRQNEISREQREINELARLLAEKKRQAALRSSNRRY